MLSVRMYTNMPLCSKQWLSVIFCISLVCSTALTFRRHIKIPVVSLDSLNFSGLSWTFKLLPGKHRYISIWHARPFASVFYRPAYVLIGR
jgi:hypothetical protein